MRCTQWIGLTERAQKIVEGGGSVLLYVEHTVREYSDGSMEKGPSRDITRPSVSREESGETWIDPFSDQPWSLNKYTFPDGRVLYERVQAEPWSSGPCVFTALTEYPEGSPEAQAFRNGAGNMPADDYFEPESLWSKEDIQAGL